ncbi:hypothetical protein [Flavobacterium sp. NKUCC04_CG]|uniref:hypothetical protein n=1 Tax=Flavobacterium sp. NKUCC04_CG TaxID=2842121 RepID=UPI001C5AAEB0|nr:hypothetical protein [Flavobacterium sp. NKUCC04_CG]MBW3517597.1 hypothetical protein [Flavobacterium sp. NKUCC04_CG]
MKKTIFLFAFISTLLMGCSKDDDSNSADKYMAFITVKDELGKNIPNTTIYALSDYTWQANNEKTDFAEWTNITDKKGHTVFKDLNDDLLKVYKEGIAQFPVEFQPKTDYKEGIFRFVIKHQDQDFITKVIFEKGEQRHFVIILK